jgi:hypothetical protein
MWSDMSRERSPLATSPRTDVASLIGPAIFSTSELTESTATAHDPAAASEARSVGFDERVEGERDLAHHPFERTIGRQTNRKVSLLGRPKGIPSGKETVVTVLEEISPWDALRRGRETSMRVGLFV